MSPFYAYVPRRLASSGIEYSIVKNSLYADPLVPYLEELIKRKILFIQLGPNHYPLLQEMIVLMQLLV